MDVLRQPKIPCTDFVLFDWLATAASAVIVNQYVAREHPFGFIIIFTILVLIAIITHALTNTPTALNYHLGLSDYPPRK